MLHLTASAQRTQAHRCTHYIFKTIASLPRFICIRLIVALSLRTRDLLLRYTLVRCIHFCTWNDTSDLVELTVCYST